MTATEGADRSIPLGSGDSLRLRSFASAVRRLAAAGSMLAGVALLAQLAVTLADVLDRLVFQHSLTWSGEAASLALSVIAFVGGAVAYHDGRHAAVHIVLHSFPAKLREVAEAGIEAIVLWTALSATWASSELIGTHWNDVTPILQVGVVWYVATFMLGLLLLALFSLFRLLTRHTWSIVLPVLLAVSAGAIALIWSSPVPWLVENGNAALLLTVALLLVSVLIGIPVSLAILFSTMLYLVTTDAAPVIAVPQNMLDGVSHFILLALPFFIFAGAIMEKGGISQRLVRLAMSLVGRLRGGLLQVIVVAIFLVSGISGSKVADVAAVGPIVRKELRRRGYSADAGGAVLAASAAMAETIPPSIAMLVLGSVTTISVGTLFVAGLLPAVVLALCLMVLNFLLAPRDLPVPPAEATHSAGRAVLGAILPLMMPVGMFLALRFGIATPTEISSFAVVYSLLLAIAVYREFKLRDILTYAAAGASMTGSVLFVLAVASAFAWTLSAANLPQTMVQFLQATGNDPTLFMIGSIVLMIVVGSLLEGLPAILILAPLLIPLAVKLGISDVQYGIVLILAMGIGAFIPPIGIGFFVAAAVSESKTEGAALAMLPYIIVLIAGVLLIALVPSITLALPDAFQ